MVRVRRSQLRRVEDQHVAGAGQFRLGQQLGRAGRENLERFFRLFRERKLATHVDTGCASACTIAFLGGVERSIGPKGRLGFHRASFPGMGDSDMYESNRGIRRFLIYSARLTPEFADRVFETPANSIWVPTPQELLAGGVINRVNP